MKKLAFLFLLLFCSGLLPAQENNKYVYCEIQTYLKGIGGKQGALIDFGSKSELQNDKTYKDESGQPLKFDSAIDALNFMANNGWELVQAYVFTFPACRYVLKKRIVEVKDPVK